jgi:hypothetical protein
MQDIEKKAKHLKSVRNFTHFSYSLRSRTMMDRTQVRAYHDTDQRISFEYEEAGLL